MESPDPRKNERHLWEIRWVRDLTVLAAALLVLWVAYLTRSVTAPILLAVALAYVINPLVSWCDQHWRVPRVVTAAIIIATVALGCVGLIWWGGATLVEQLEDFASSLPDYVGAAASLLGINLEQLPEQLRAMAVERLESSQEAGTAPALSDIAGPVAAAVKHLYTLVFAVISSVAGLMTYLPVAMVVVAFCFFFFTWHWQAIVGWFEQFIPVSSREKSLDVIAKMDRTVAAFIRGRLIQALVMGILLSIGWWLAEVPYWLLLGMGCGLLNLVPFLAIIGWIAAIVLVAIDQLSNMNQTEVAETFRLATLIWPTIVYFAAQFFDAWVVEPLVQGKATNLDPLTVLLSVLIGGTLAGLLGMLLAIPAAGCVKILGQEVIVPHLRKYAQREVQPQG